MANQPLLRNRPSSAN